MAHAYITILGLGYATEEEKHYAVFGKPSEAHLHAFGDIYSSVNLLGTAPVSSQADAKRKDLLRESIQSRCKSITWLYANDVQVEIVWYCDTLTKERDNTAPDIDNIAKPILDALCGVNGIIIDDAQVNDLSLRRKELPTDTEEYVEIRVTDHNPSIHLVLKSAPKFFETKYNRRCFYPQFTAVIRSGLEEDMINAGSLQRIFHKSRLQQHLSHWSLAEGKELFVDE